MRVNIEITRLIGRAARGQRWPGSILKNHGGNASHLGTSLERQLEVPSLNRERIKLSADSGAGIVQPSDVRNGVG